MTTDPCFHVWTIYEHPADYPNSYVARRRSVGPGGEVNVSRTAYVTTDLEMLRDVMRGMALARVARDPNDDPVILESWL